ncbi:MAG: hypothetical protein AB1585_03190 [Thermodesulfobacteriota bacterium]
MRIVEFHRLLEKDTALRVRFELERGKILKFTVQMECRFVEIEGWISIVRYDTAHGFAHCDILFPYDKPKKIKMEIKDYNDALTAAINDLGINWKRYRKRYEEWLRKK